MTLHRSIVWPGSARITLALLAIVPAVMAYPWRSARDYWIVGVGAAVVIVLFSWWRGLHLTTLLRRRLAILSRRRLRFESDCGTKTTALLRVGSPAFDGDALPLLRIAQYLDCYGLRADTIRITSRGSASGAYETWIGLTVSAADNLDALLARSSRVPVHETAQVAARRLADHLREIGWEASMAVANDLPQLLARDAKEIWRGVCQGDSDYVAAYRVSVDEGLPETLTAIRSYPARETWVALEIAGHPSDYTVAVACSFRTEALPESAAPVSGLTPQRGDQLPALAALDPSSTQRLDGHTAVPGLLAGIDWPTAGNGTRQVLNHEAPSRT